MRGGVLTKKQGNNAWHVCVPQVSLEEVIRLVAHLGPTGKDGMINYERIVRAAGLPNQKKA